MVNAAQSIPTTEEIFNRAEALFADIEQLDFDFAAEVAGVVQRAVSEVPYKHQTKEMMLEALSGRQLEQLRQMCEELPLDGLEKLLEIAHEIKARTNTVSKRADHGQL